MNFATLFKTSPKSVHECTFRLKLMYISFCGLYTDDDDYFETIQYSYDKNKNPFYGCYTTGIYDEDYQHEMASKNNVVSEIWDDGDHVEYTYQYDKKNFPTSKTLIYTGEDYTCTWYYEYE